MAASKDVFEPKVFAANAFAAGAFRGTGADIAFTLSGKWSDIEYIHANRDRTTIRSDRARTAIRADRQRIEVRG